MANREQEHKCGRMETGHNRELSNTSERRVILSVDFEEMNFEQRRAPYKEIGRNRAERDYSANQIEKRPDPKPDGRWIKKPCTTRGFFIISLLNTIYLKPGFLIIDSYITPTVYRDGYLKK